jgi:hypothetical protein
MMVGEIQMQLPNLLAARPPGVAQFLRLTGEMVFGIRVGGHPRASSNDQLIEVRVEKVIEKLPTVLKTSTVEQFPVRAA